jgi:hypothetical protein
LRVAAAAALEAAWPGRAVAVRAYLVDPPGSVLFARVAHGVAYAPQAAERTLRRHRCDTVVEGVGCDRLTAMFSAALPLLDGAFQCSDAEAVAMAEDWAAISNADAYAKEKRGDKRGAEIARMAGEHMANFVKALKAKANDETTDPMILVNGKWMPR